MFDKLLSIKNYLIDTLHRVLYGDWCMEPVIEDEDVHEDMSDEGSAVAQPFIQSGFQQK